MKFNRQFTEKNNDAYSGLEFKTTTSEIKNPDGTIVFKRGKIWSLTDNLPKKTMMHIQV